MKRACILQDINKNSTEINRRKVQIETGQKMIKKLTKGIEESKKEKERLIDEKQSLLATFKEIEQKAFTVQENYNKTQEVKLKFVFFFLFQWIFYFGNLVFPHFGLS